VNTPSAELALPRGPDGVQAPAPAGGQLAELVVRLLGELEDVAGEGEGVALSSCQSVDFCIFRKSA